tara:strand:+ start:4000 stop:4653 length:654 start_codon:yes stop_codon:yes gene_type:complete
MQSDTFINDTDSDDENSDYESDSSGDLPKNNNIGVKYDFPKESITDKRFLDQSSQEKYSKLRNELFTPEILKGRIVFYSYHTNDSTHKETIDLLDQYKLNGLDNVIGFEMISARILPVEITNMVPFIDLVIPEIPHVACKQNEYGIPIISRLNTDNNTDIYSKTDYEKEYNNYFTPIKLSKLTLKLFGVDGTLITSDHPKIIYEFEITVLNRSLSQR